VGELRAALEEWGAALLADENMSQTRDTGLAWAGVVLAFLQRLFGSILAFGTLLVLLPIYTYFLLFELERIHRFVRHYMPAGERTRLSRVGAQIGEVLANFFRGRLLVCLLKGLGYALGLWIAGIDYALLIGLGTGFLSLVPFVGSVVGAVLACLIGFLSHDLVGTLWRVTVVFVVVELIENYLLVPKILGDTLALHPVVVIFAIRAGGAAFGMFGLLVALPVTASLVILAREFLLPTLEQIARGDGPRARSSRG
jgi:predicted PurR-regulated permease PerM